MGQNQHIFVVSDATGQTAEMVLQAALVQFQGAKVEIHRLGQIRTREQIAEVVREAARVKGFIVHTFVSEELRQVILSEGMRWDVATIDLLGPLLFRLEDLLKVPPLAKPGLFRQLQEDYHRRIEVLEFAVKHDDGQNVKDLVQADIVLIGVSRTSKTPLSIYLAGRGWKVANIPVILRMPLPEEVLRIEQQKIVGLTIKAERLLELRRARLARMEAGLDLAYADPEQIREELDYSRSLFRRFGWPVIDVTNKAIEETASEILAMRQREGEGRRPIGRTRRPISSE